jgi:signal transduction histidine kinase
MGRRRPQPCVLVAATAMVWLAAWQPASGQQGPVRTVLGIYLGEEEFPSNPVLDRAIRETLTSRPDMPIEYFSEYLESERFDPTVATETLHDYIRAKYQGHRIDVVIAMTDQVLQFALNHRHDLFPGASIVFTALRPPPETTRTTDNGVTGIVVSNAFGETLKLGLDLHPGTQRVLVVARSPNEQSVAAVRSELAHFSRQTRLTFIDERTVPGMVAAVRAAPPRSLILYIWQAQEEPGNFKYSDEFARLVAEAAPVPVYGTSDLYVGSGVVGGVMRETRETGMRAAEMALQILGGTRAQDIPIERARLVPVFDWRQVRRWGIDPLRLPSTSDIRFRTPTVWESYRWYIVTTLLVVAAQLVLIAGLLTQRARRRRAEEAIRTSEASLRKSYERIRQMAGRLINAQEAARADIARDLHDDVCQRLTYVSVGVSTLKNSSGDIQGTETQRAFADLERDTLGTFDGIRRLSHDLHPATLRLLGLAPALRSHCAELEKRYNVQIAFTTVDLGRVHPDVAVCFFRIGQEALRNGLVHGDAQQFAVSLARYDNYIEMTVSDNGRGFDLEAVSREGGGLGLVSMEERAHVVGGGVQIVTAIGHGTTVRVRGPAEPSSAIGSSEATRAEHASSAVEQSSTV